MLFLNLNSVILVLLGTGFLVFARRLSNLILKHSPENWMTTGVGKELLFVWPIRLMGLMCLGFAFAILVSNFPQGGMKSDKNRIRLLESGNVVEAEVLGVVFQRIAPSGWEVRYSFSAENPTTGELQTYVGSAQGPKGYYASLSKGNTTEILFDPKAPKVNCEIRCFLNNPSFKHTFREAGKLPLLDKFRDKYEVRDYSFEEWYRQQQQK